MDNSAFALNLSAVGRELQAMALEIKAGEDPMEFLTSQTHQYSSVSVLALSVVLADSAMRGVAWVKPE